MTYVENLIRFNGNISLVMPPLILDFFLKDPCLFQNDYCWKNLSNMNSHFFKNINFLNSILILLLTFFEISALELEEFS